MYILSYLSNRKRCVRINNKYCDFENITPGVPRGTILGPLLLNLSINDLLFFMLIASVHNDTLPSFHENLSKLINIF